MQLTKIKISNYRLLSNAELDVDDNMTLIVGRNNTAKTSFMELIEKIMNDEKMLFDDYPLNKRNLLYDLLSKFIKKEISYTELCNSIPLISVGFWIDYSLEDEEDDLGFLSPFIIDIDLDTTTAIIYVEYKVKSEEQKLRELFTECFYKDGVLAPDYDEVKSVFNNVFSKIFEATIYAVNPQNTNDRQIRSLKELKALFPIYLIPAERVLGEDGNKGDSSLGKLIASFFDMNEEELSPNIAEKVMELRQIIATANKKVQEQSDNLLSSVVNSAVGFGYPNAEELQLSVTTKLSIDDQIKNHTSLKYVANDDSESLPSSYNGLGYKNLIKIEFLLAGFAKEIQSYSKACIPLLFIEEPESHMHPQMQQTFAKYLCEFLEKISDIHIQTFITSHSAHIANTVDFSQVRYAQKTLEGVIYKNLQCFSSENEENVEFIRKYLTLSRCDLFFADKVIMVEGASERLLLPDMINKCYEKGMFDEQKYKLPAQYYTIVEIGGAYAHKFVPFINFLEIPCLIITDIDSVKQDRKKCVVSEGETTSNATLKWWMKKIKQLPDEDKSPVNLEDILDLSEDDKTIEKCHIEFQTKEAGLCGRSLEEAIKNANREIYGLVEPVNESMIAFNEKSKTDFALELICKGTEYEPPTYIKEGLVWLNNQNVLV